MTQAYQPSDVLKTVDSDKGLVSRHIFSDADIYRLELKQIFARAWNFMAHDSQIPKPGDFFMTFIGEDRVICVRDLEGSPQVLVNSCRHRGNAVCRAEEGHATSFMCTYHGWTYDLKGALVGVPGFKEVYHEELDRENWGLIKAAKVDSYKGFIFATLAETAPDLEEYLGDVGRLCIDMLAVKGEMAVVAGVQKYIIPCNWKFTADNIWDLYHIPVTHASVLMSSRSLSGISRSQTPSGASLNTPQMAWLGDYGHALAGGVASEERRAKKARKGRGSENWHQRPEAKELLGAAINSHGSSVLFPNFSIYGYHAVLRLPKGPSKTESWWFFFLDKQLPADVNASILQRERGLIGPAGLQEQDDSENWEQSTIGSRGFAGRAFPLNYAMGLGRGEFIEEDTGPVRLEAGVNEHAQRWFYRGWAEWMTAASWAELKASHSTATPG